MNVTEFVSIACIYALCFLWVNGEIYFIMLIATVIVFIFIKPPYNETELYVHTKFRNTLLNCFISSTCGMIAYNNEVSLKVLWDLT